MLAWTETLRSEPPRKRRERSKLGGFRRFQKGFNAHHSPARSTAFMNRGHWVARNRRFLWLGRRQAALFSTALTELRLAPLSGRSASWAVVALHLAHRTPRAKSQPRLGGTQ